MRNYEHPLICFEGLDASGKATMSAYAADLMRGVVFSFPRYDTPTGKLLLRHLKGEVEMVTRQPPCRGNMLNTNDDMITRQVLMTANRLEAQDQILQALRASPVVLDRYWLSSLVYGVAEGLNSGWIADISSTLLRPDLTIVLDIPVEEVARRLPQARDKNESDLDKLRRVRDLYRNSIYCGTYPNDTVVINADRPLDLIKAEVRGLVSDFAHNILSGDYDLSCAQIGAAKRS